MQSTPPAPLVELTTLVALVFGAFLLIESGIFTGTPSVIGTTIGGVFRFATNPNCPVWNTCCPAGLVNTIAPCATSTCRPFCGVLPLAVGTPPQSFWQNS